MGGISVTSSKSKMPHTLKLVSAISSYLFEEEFDEMQYLKESEIKSLKSICRKLLMRASKNTK